MMRIFYGFDQVYGLEKSVVTMGSYDGVHLGHRAIIERVVDTARERGTQSVVVTFDPHPRIAMGQDRDGFGQINTLREKAMILDSLGVDMLVVVDFNDDFRRITAYDFVRDLLVGTLDVGVLYVGFNHRFGRDMQGDFAFLDLQKEYYGYELIVNPEFKVDAMRVSSTVVRKTIQQGDLALAAKLLGAPYFVIGFTLADGTVTYNNELKLLPLEGDYAVNVSIGVNSFDSVARIEPEGVIRMVTQQPLPANLAVNIRFLDRLT